MRTSRRRQRAHLGLEALETRVVPSTYYVATSGNDTNAGTKAAPFATIQHAMISLNAGDTLDVEAGSYAGFIVGWDSVAANTGDPYGTINGTASAPITIQADPAAAPGSVIINSKDNKTQAGIDLEPGDSYITISGFTIDGTGGGFAQYPNHGEGIKVAGSNNDIVENCTITNVNYGQGIIADNANNVLIQNNTITGTGNNGNAYYGHGIYLSGSSNGAIIKNNVIDNNSYIGIHVNGDVSEGGVGLVTNALIEDNYIYNNGQNGINCDGIQNSTIENNLIYGYASYGLALYKSDAAGPSSNNIIVDNTIVSTNSTAGAAVRILDGSTGNTLLNNVLLGGGDVFLRISNDSLSGLVSNYNAVSSLEQSEDTGNTESFATWQSGNNQDAKSFIASSSALFANATTNNYQLSSTSPVINAGTATDAPSTDILGNARPQTRSSGNGYDIGAYEYVSTNSITLGPASLPASTVGVAYNQTITASGGSGTLTVTDSITSGSIPAGLTFSISGSQLDITGTPTASGTVSFSVTATDTSGDTTTQNYTLTINSGVSLSPTSVPAGTVGTSYSQSISASGGTGTLTVTDSITSGSIPAGLTFSISGSQLSISGTPTASGTVGFSVTATDSVGATATQTYTLTVNPSTSTATQLVVTTQPPSSITAGNSFSVVVDAETANGTVATSFTGSVTIALANNPTGGTLNGTLTVTAVNGVATFSGLTLDKAGTGYTLQATSSGLTAATTTAFDISSAAASTLVVSGFPTSVTAGTAHNFTVTAEDAFGNTATGYTGTVKFRSSDFAAALPGRYTFTSSDAGVHTFSATLKTVGTQWIKAIDTKTYTIAGKETGITVTASSSGTRTGSTTGSSGTLASAATLLSTAGSLGTTSVSTPAVVSSPTAPGINWHPHTGPLTEGVTTSKFPRPLGSSAEVQRGRGHAKAPGDGSDPLSDGLGA
jgi:parallel beta-helix repeat protein